MTSQIQPETFFIVLLTTAGSDTTVASQLQMQQSWLINEISFNKLKMRTKVPP